MNLYYNILGAQHPAVNWLLLVPVARTKGQPKRIKKTCFKFTRAFAWYTCVFDVLSFFTGFRTKDFNKTREFRYCRDGAASLAREWSLQVGGLSSASEVYTGPRKQCYAKSSHVCFIFFCQFMLSKRCPDVHEVEPIPRYQWRQGRQSTGWILAAWSSEDCS